jgi:site-specific DNA recombinase
VIGNQYIHPDTGRDAPAGNGAIPAYVDDYTSRELSRPSLNGLLSYLDSVGFDVVIVYALDRLARDPYIRQTLERDFAAKGAKVEFVLGNYEETPEGEIRKDLDATFAKWENATRVERCNRGKKRKAENGKFVTGRAPYGYAMDKNAPGGLAIQTQQAELVKRIFLMFVDEGLSMRQIAARLNDEDIPSHQGGIWRPASIHAILSNTAYIGYFFYNKRKRVGGKNVDRPREEWIRIECEPIITDRLFKAAQPILKENRDYKWNMPARFYLLAGMVFCSECRHVYAPETSTDWSGQTIRKYRHRRNLGHCSNRSLTEKRLGRLVWTKISNKLLHPEVVRSGYLNALESQRESTRRQREHLEALRRKVFALEQQRQNLTTAYLDPDLSMTKKEYIEQRSRIDHELKYLYLDVERYENEIEVVPTPAELETLEIFAAEIRKRLKENEDPSDEEKRKLFELLHVKVMVDGEGEIEVSGWISETGAINVSDLAICRYS